MNFYFLLKINFNIFYSYNLETCKYNNEERIKFEAHSNPYKKNI